MPKYEVHIYNVHVEVFEVEAEDPSEAEELAHDYEYVMGMAREDELERFAGTVTHTVHNKHSYEADAQVWRVEADGSLTDVTEQVGDGVDDPPCASGYEK